MVSIEVDEDLADDARRRLQTAGADVTVETADGAAGWHAAAPFDRVIATYAVAEVPWPWVEQTRPGGRIVTPWGRLGHVALTVAEDSRSASGRMRGLATFMPARGTSGPGRGYQEVRGDGEAKDERPVTRDLTPLREDWNLLFALRVALPEVRIITAVDEDGVNAWLHDGEASWAMLAALGDGKTLAYQGGPRFLADEVEQAWDRWLSLEATVYDFGMTVSPHQQYVWCKDPASGARWPAATTQRPPGDTPDG